MEFYDLHIKYYDEKEPVHVRQLNRDQLILMMGYALDERKRCIKEHRFLNLKDKHIVEWVKIE